MLEAWRGFLRGKKKRQDVAVFAANLMDNILLLHCELVDKKYCHGSYQAFKINDPKPRDIYKASVRDRLLHHAIYRVLYPYFDKKFIFDSFSCRQNKGTHRAINRFREYGRIVSHNHARTIWILKCDIKKFFASIDHRILIDILKRHLDSDTVWLLEKVIVSFSTAGKLGVGLPLGNLTSQLLANVYLNELDHFLKRELKIKHCVRYADDIIILHECRSYLENILLKTSKFLKKRLKLSFHPNKVFIKTLSSGIDFLGWVHFLHHRVLRASTRRRLFRKFDRDNSDIVASYRGLLKHGNTYQLMKKLMVS
ncbi:MAG: reverse transcriptase/maturase family protein [Patescibacteria group bacterium]